MSRFLPTSEFKWINPTSSKRFVLEVDLEYAKELQKLQNDYPLAPVKIEIKREML